MLLPCSVQRNVTLACCIRKPKSSGQAIFLIYAYEAYSDPRELRGQEVPRWEGYMFTFHVDETGKSGSTKFFYIGGLVADDEQMIAGSQGVQEIRQKYGYQETDLFKFTTNSRPNHLSIGDWTDSKHEAICLIRDLELKFLVTMVHHKIAKPLERPQGVIWNLENLLRHYSKLFLTELPGAVCLDRIEENWGHEELAKIAENQIEFGNQLIGIPNIVHFSFTAARFSKFNSLVDIALGSFHMCCENAFDPTNTHKSAITQQILSELYPCLPKSPDTNLAWRHGVFPQPMGSMKAEYQADYDRVYEYLGSNRPK